MVDQNTSAIIISSHKGRPITKWSKIIICIAPIIEPRRSAPQRSFQLPQLFLGWEAGVWGVVSSVFRTLDWAERRPALAQALMAPVIC